MKCRIITNHDKDAAESQLQAVIESFNSHTKYSVQYSVSCSNGNFFHHILVMWD